MFKTPLLLILLFLLLSGNILFEVENHQFFNSTFRPEKFKTKRKAFIRFNDSIPDDTLTIYFSEADLPQAFSRNIYTAVCLDTVCRLVHINLYYEITGKYLGYTLPPGEKLTKKEHTPFTEGDYWRLNEIFRDSSSQLRTFTPEDIHPAKKAVIQTDGITGATLPDLAAWIVPEAAYTTYTLWHITYGPTRDSILTFTKNCLLSGELISNLLKENDPYNQTKALQWIGNANLNCKQFVEPAINVLHSQNYKTAGEAMKFLKYCGVKEERLQKEVITLLDSEDFRIKYVAIEYFRESPFITQSVAQEMMARLNLDNYFLVNVILSLLEKKFHPNQHDQQNLAKLLESKNINVANRVYHFLLNLPDKSPGLVKQLGRYRKKAL
jgi:hypothetical protein